MRRGRGRGRGTGGAGLPFGARLAGFIEGNGSWILPAILSHFLCQLGFKAGPLPLHQRDGYNARATRGESTAMVGDFGRNLAKLALPRLPPRTILTPLSVTFT